MNVNNPNLNLVHVIVIYLLKMESLSGVVKYHKYLSPIRCGQTVT